MTNKEFKRLSRAQLIDIIYEFQLKQEELTAENFNSAQALYALVEKLMEE